MYAGPIIDTHHHIWQVRHYPWLLEPMAPRIFGESYAPLRQDYLLDDLLADFAGHNVVRSVHVQAHYNEDDPVGETRWLQGIADRSGYPHGIVGYAPLAADDVEAMLAAHAEFANFRGIRDHVTWEPSREAWRKVDRADACLSPGYRRGVRLLGEMGLHCELQAFPNQFHHLAALVGDHPAVRFCLVHMGLLTGDDPASIAAWETGLKHLAPLPNLFVKCSGINNVTWGPPRPFAPVAAQLNTLIDMFGAERCFFGSNFPVEKLKSSFASVMAMTKAALADRPEAEQRAFFHDTAAGFYLM